MALQRRVAAEGLDEIPVGVLGGAVGSEKIVEGSGDRPGRAAPIRGPKPTALDVAAVVADASRLRADLELGAGDGLLSGFSAAAVRRRVVCAVHRDECLQPNAVAAAAPPLRRSR